MRESSWFCLSRALAVLIAFGHCSITTACYGQSVPEEKLTVAILEFEDTSPKDEFARLGRALQSMLTTDLAASRDMALVERARLEDVRAELNLVKTGFLDPKTAAKVGKGVGAKAVLTGSFWVREGQMRIDARLVHVETGEVLLAEEISGATTKFTELEKQLARKVLDATGIRLSAFERADLKRQHTSSLVAASRYGQALNAEDEGNLEEAQRSATAALEVDPEFALAQQLLRQVAGLLDCARDDDFRRKVISITQFEDSLNGHPFGHPLFEPDEYPQLLKDEGPERALFYWISRSGVNPISMGHRMTIARTNPYNSMFKNPSGIGRSDGWASRTYLDLGGADPVLFWCDVVTSDPKYAPSIPLTDQMLNPNPLSTPVWGPYPAYFFWRLPDVYNKRFEAQAWIQGDFPTALKTLETARRVCQPLMSESAYRRRLEELNEILSSPKQLSLKQSEARERRQLWRLAHDQIVTYHAANQDERCGLFDNPLDVPNMDEVRRELTLQYASNTMVMFGGRAAQEREAKRIVDDLLKEAGDAKFSARNTLVPSDGDEPRFLMLMHLSGCPRSHLSNNERIASNLPLQTGFDETIDSGFQKMDDPSIGIENGWIPCPHCRPLRWFNDGAVQGYLSEKLPKAISRFIKDETAITKAELENLLVAFQDEPTKDARASLRRLCEHVCNKSTGDRTLHAKALRAMARVTTPDDASWLITLIQSQPWWDVRINAAATLATIADKSVLSALSRTIDGEQYYFVRHGLEAARARAQESMFRLRLQDIRSRSTEADWKAAQIILEDLLDETEGNKHFPSTMRLRWKTHFHLMLSKAGEEQGDVDALLKHLRRVVELNPDIPGHKNSLGYSLAMYGRSLIEAEQLLRSAIAQDKKQKAKAGEAVSENPFYLHSLGFVLLKQGRYAEAKVYVARSLEFPEVQLLECYDQLGDIHWELGEKKEAIAAWKKSLEVARDTPFEQELKASIVEKVNERDKP